MTGNWLERPKTIRLLWILFIAVLALTVAAEFVVDPHGYFGLGDTFGFNAWFGFASCVAMIVFAKLLGHFLKRPDTYYEGE